MSTNAPFEGRTAWMTARVMAVQNRAAEAEAIDVLDPAPGGTVAAIGCGAGVGVELLAPRVGRVLAIDPSPAMAAETRRRNRDAIATGRVEVVETSADQLPCPDGCLDGAISVNSIQLWDPLDASLTEVARALRPGARLVTLTHDWAIERSTRLTVPVWLEALGDAALNAGLVDLRSWRAGAERGRSVAVALTRAGER